MKHLIYVFEYIALVFVLAVDAVSIGILFTTAQYAYMTLAFLPLCIWSYMYVHMMHHRNIQKKIVQVSVPANTETPTLKDSLDCINDHYSPTLIIALLDAFEQSYDVDDHVEPELFREYSDLYLRTSDFAFYQMSAEYYALDAEERTHQHQQLVFMFLYLNLLHKRGEQLGLFNQKQQES